MAPDRRFALFVLRRFLADALEGGPRFGALLERGAEEACCAVAGATLTASAGTGLLWLAVG